MSSNDAAPVIHEVTGAGTFHLTRVTDPDHGDRAEIRMSVLLAPNDRAANQQLTALATHIAVLLGPPRPVPGKAPS